jgi:flagellar biosynthesis/type III secretory pathway ATPase
VPKLVERMGRTAKGSITGILTVLLDQDDPNDPVSNTLRGLLDGHLYLTRELANRGHYPAIDVLGSLSRLMHGLADASQSDSARKLRELLSAFREGRDLVEIGAYKAGSNPRLDEALALMPAIDAFLRQRVEELTPLEQTQALMAMIAARVGSKS